MAPLRRLAHIGAHLQGAALRRPRTASVDAAEPAPVLLDDREMKEFIKSGIHMIPPGSPGMPDASVHYANWEDACAMQESATAGVHSIADNVISSVPGVRDVLESPAVRGVLQSVIGKGYTYHPHHFMHMTSPQTDQFWYGFSPSLAPSIVLTACGAGRQAQRFWPAVGRAQDAAPPQHRGHASLLPDGLRGGPRADGAPAHDVLLGGRPQASGGRDP